jgi:hypothetical protein
VFPRGVGSLPRTTHQGKGMGICLYFLLLGCQNLFALPLRRYLERRSTLSNALRIPIQLHTVLNPMPRRTSINDVQELEQLNDLELIVKDKRNEKRADSKKERRNRHYVKVLIKQQLTHTTDEGESGDR